MDPGTQQTSLAAKSDISRKGHKRMKILEAGEYCTSSAVSPKVHGDREVKPKTAALKSAVDSFDPFAVPNLCRALDRRRFGSKTEEIEALRSLKLKLLNHSLGVKPAQPFMLSNVENSKRHVLNSEDIEDNESAHQNVSHLGRAVAVDRRVSHQEDETLSDQSVNQPTQESSHLKDDQTGNDYKEETMEEVIVFSDDEDNANQRPSNQCHKVDDQEETMPVIVIVSDDEDIGIQRPSHQCHKVVKKGSSGEPSMNGNIEENDQINIADDGGSKPSGIYSEMFKSLDQVTGCSEIKASEEEAKTVPSIDGTIIIVSDDEDNVSQRSSHQCHKVVKKGSSGEPSMNDNIMVKEETDHINIADDGRSKPSGIDNELFKSLDQVTGCSDIKASEEEVKTAPSIGDMPAKDTYIDTDDINNDQTDIADDMQSKPSEIDSAMDESVDHLDRETSGEEVESVPDDAFMPGECRSIDTNDYQVIEENNNQADIGDDGLADIWNEMAFSLECSKDIAQVCGTSQHSREDEEDCDHSLVLKDDLGYVCRICGFIERGIETIFEFQYGKVKRTTRTYVSEPRKTSNRGLNAILSGGVNCLGDNSVLTEVYAHPRHQKLMKPHQVEGFNFLCSNLLADDPKGCILAHAPGSGKTFMIISFMQSFLAKNPQGRPLVVLPKGILATWKKEFKTWQVEDIPLLDFYSSKAENRSQQLEVLLQWEEQKSILFLGYTQFSKIVCGDSSCKEAADCQDKLLKVPTILILDEGHTPRNEETDVLQSLAQVQTPRKVVLSGTLYQNHVKEVFNILNLVRPRFLHSETSRAVVSRIMSCVQISGVKKHLKAGKDLASFYELVENTLRKDDNFKRKVAVIENLREMTKDVLHYYKGDYLNELPGLIDLTVVLNLSAEQKKEVKELNKLSKFKKISHGSNLYVHPELKYFSDKYPSAGDRNSSVNNERLDQLLEKLDVRHGAKMKFFLNMLGLCEASGEKLLVFSQYILPLKLLERASTKSKGWILGKELFFISGESSSEQREWSMQQFNSSPDAKVFFGSIKACGEGISLVGASRILILDVHLNPSVTRQAIGRAYRPGQKRKVYSYRLVAADSPEEEDYNACSGKESISKMWFEWSKGCEKYGDIEVVDLANCADKFLESPLLQEDVKVLYKR